MTSGDVDLVAQFADETDPQQPRLDAGDRAQAHAKIREACGRQIKVGTDLLQHLARIRARHVDRSNGRRDVGDVHVQTPLGIPLEHLLINAIHTAGGGGDVEMLVGKARANAVVDDHALLVGHQRITRTPDRLFEKGEGIQAVEQLGGVGAAYVQAAECRHVDDADLVAHVQRFLLHAGIALRGFAIERRTLPDPGRHHFRACLHMTRVHGCLPIRIKGTACNVCQFLGLEGRPGCGHAGFTDTALGRSGHQSCSRQCRVTTLRRAHAHRGIAFYQLDVAIADARGIDDIAYLKVFVEVDKILAVRVREDRPGEVDLRFAAQRGWGVSRGQAQCRDHAGGGMRRIGQHVVQRVVTVDRARDAQVLRQAADREFGLFIVIGQLAAGLTQQLVDRHIAAGHAQQVAVDTRTAVRHLPLAGDLAQLGAAHMAHAFLMQRFIDRCVHVADDAALLQRKPQRPVRRAAAHVGHCNHVDALIVQIQCGEVTVIIAGQHHRAFAGLDGVQLDQTLCSTGQHHAGEVVVAENHWLIE